LIKLQDNNFLTKIIKIWDPPSNHIMTPLSLLICFLLNIFLNYMIKIYGKKIEYQSKNKNLFKTVIILWKAKKNKTNHAVYFSTNSILNDKIKKTIRNN
jgi:hypothetical protein